MGALDEKALGKRLQMVRRERGFTQQTLCQAANLSYSTLAKIERGAIKSPSIFTVVGIAQAMGVTLDELLGLTGAGAPVAAATAKKTQSGVSFVYFDLNDTLVRAAQRGFTRLAEQSGVTPDVIEALFWHYNDALNHGTMSMSDFNDILGKRLGMAVDWREVYLSSAEAIEGMPELLRWAAGMYRVGVLSNTLPGMISGLRERGILPDVPYATIIDSSEVGTGKPEPRIYELAEERAGVPPTELLLIDDNRTNIVAAEQRGWHVALFDGYRPAESIERLRLTLQPAD